MLCGAALLGLDMAIPLYPGPPSFELGLEVTGVGLYFDGKGELGSLIQVNGFISSMYVVFISVCIQRLWDIVHDHLMVCWHMTAQIALLRC
jgi:hypothetical protein